MESDRARWADGQHGGGVVGRQRRRIRRLEPLEMRMVVGVGGEDEDGPLWVSYDDLLPIHTCNWEEHPELMAGAVVTEDPHAEMSNSFVRVSGPNTHRPSLNLPITPFVSNCKSFQFFWRVKIF